jgi:restriction endonuclease S subunit
LNILYKLTEEILLEADLETADAKVQKIFDQAKTYRTEVKKELKENRR